MRIVRYSTQFKKDVKRYASMPDKLEALFKIVKYLEQEKPIPSEYKPHRLKGRLKGCWECHVQSDVLLIWIDESNNIICLERFGTHSELFKL